MRILNVNSARTDGPQSIDTDLFPLLEASIKQRAKEVLLPLLFGCALHSSGFTAIAAKMSVTTLETQVVQ